MLRAANSIYSPHFAVWPAKRSVLERAVCYLAACSDNNTVGVREFMGCNGIIHSIHLLSFSSSDRFCIVCISRKGPQVISSQSYTEKLSKRRNKAVWSSIARFFKAMNSSSRSYRKAGFLAIFKHSTCNVMKFRRPF